MTRIAALLVALLAAVGTAAAPAWAAGSDLAALSRDGRQGAIGATVSVPLGIANHGPDVIGGKEVTLGFRAPAGTVIVRANGATNCEFNQARTTARCQLGAGWRVAVAAQPKGSYQDLQLKIVAKVTAPGLFTVACGCDPKKANDATNIVVNGVTKPQPSASPKASARPSARASASPSPQQSLSPEATEDPVAGDSTEPAAAEQPPPAGKDSTSSGFMLIGIGAVLFGLVGLGGAAFLWRDRSGGDDDGEE
ncbi:hypothetical protein [Catellatospora sp. NPDC049609]|uniref:hypothetical protein n=1 Tax=Catellatospora sp. NPDC049609 TaxID=3155505 RepID=UPI00343A5EC6